MSTKKRIALVTGASRGIGKAISKKLIKNGITVFGTSRNQEGIRRINKYLSNNGEACILDVRDPVAVKDLVTYIHSNFSCIDILINNAGLREDSLLIKMKYSNWKNVMDINLSSIFYLSKSVVPSMMKQRYGRIINISSVVGMLGNTGQANYAAAKSGIIGFSKSLAREIASRNITVNVVSPGFIETDMTSSLSEIQRAAILSKIPAKRLGHADEVAAAVSFLCSEDANYISGETLHVNGGMYMP